MWSSCFINGCLFFLQQSEVEDVFRFVTFIINFVVFLVQFVLSTVSDKRSKYQLVGEDNVRGIPYSGIGKNIYNFHRILVQSCHQVSCPT